MRCVYCSALAARLVTNRFAPPGCVSLGRRRERETWMCGRRCCASVSPAPSRCALHDAACRLFRSIKWQLFQCACNTGLALAARCNCCANPFGHASLALNLKQEREITHARLQQAAPRLGTLGVRRRGIDVQEVCSSFLLVCMSAARLVWVRLGVRSCGLMCRSCVLLRCMMRAALCTELFCSTPGAACKCQHMMPILHLGSGSTGRRSHTSRAPVPPCLLTA